MKITETSSNRPKRLKTSITELDACISIATGLRFFFFFFKASLAIFNSRFSRVERRQQARLGASLVRIRKVLLFNRIASRDYFGYALFEMESFKSCAFFFLLLLWNVKIIRIVEICERAKYFLQYIKYWTRVNFNPLIQYLISDFFFK